MNPFILNIETSGDTCSVVLSKGNEIIGIKENTHREHSKYLSVFIDELINEAGISYNNIDAVAVSKGPGSYTGLRIGVATAKGICYGLGKPLIAVNSLLSLASVCKRDDVDALYCPLIDARRLEVYTAMFDSSLVQMSETEAVIISEDSFADILENKKIYFFGSGAEKCKAIITHPNAVFIQVNSSATGLVALANEAYENKRFEDTAYFEPFYLKDFVVTTKKKKLF